jgi:sugar lactone lactonase YvrE
LCAALACVAYFAATPCFADILGADFFFNSVLRLDHQSGAYLPGGITGGFPGSAGLESPAGVTVGPDGNIYVSSQGTGEILFYEGSTGAALPSPLPGGRDGLFAALADATSPNPAPAHLAFGPDGHLYVGDFNSPRVRVVNGTSGAQLPDAAAVATNVGGLAFGPDGDLYVGDFSAAMVWRVDNGVAQPFFAPQTGGLATPAALLFTPDNYLLVVDLYGNQIIKYDSNGQNPQQFAVIPPAIPDPLPPGVNVPSNNPSDIAFDQDGNLLVSALGLTYPPDNRGAIHRYTLDGQYVEQVAGGLPAIGAVAWIASLDAVRGDYDENGTVEAADYNKWQADFGKWVAKGGGADGSGNGVVDAADYVVWRDALGGAVAASAAAVPEPAAGLLAIVAGAVALVSQARRARRRF